MNKKAIWAIIALMSAAVIGVVWLQMDLIRTSINVNEEKFDKNVYEALNAVVERLEKDEQIKAFNYIANGYSLRSIGAGNGILERQKMMDFNLSIEDQINQGRQKFTSSYFLLNKLMADFLSDDNCNCSKCVNDRINPSNLYHNFNHGSANLPLEERIKPEQLKEILDQEFEDRGIDTEYDFGVFSKMTKTFVIYNDHYVVEDTSPKEILPGHKNIYNSKYRVHVFPNEMPSLTGGGVSPGLLMIHFPAKTSFVWSSVWLNFLGSILFTALILFCFAYTINVIFRQKKLSEMKTDFINNMTHEFKTPIATISLAADSITSPMISGNSEKVQRFANIIKQENKRMNNQVEKVLQMARIDKKEFSLKLAEVNLHDVIERAIEYISLQVEKKSGTAQAFMNAENDVIEGDLTHISNVINNLLDNANKYSPDYPDISIHTRNLSNGVEVIVQDKGVGMSKEARKHIFDKFYRVHTGDLHDVKGFGLGLSYVKAIMNAHKGQIDVKSELGKGSSFILFFPFQVGERA